MTQAQASAFAKLALKGIHKEYPNKPGTRAQQQGRHQGPAGICTRPSTAASIGTRRCMATGCWFGCCAVPESARAEANPAPPWPST